MSVSLIEKPFADEEKGYEAASAAIEAYDTKDSVL